MAEPLPVVPQRRAGRLTSRGSWPPATPPCWCARTARVVGILTRFDMLQFIAGGE